MSKRKKTIIRGFYSVCSDCGEPVCSTENDIAVRHGFKRHRRKKMIRTAQQLFSQKDSFSQEDGKACDGSGKEVVWKKVKK